MSNGDWLARTTWIGGSELYAPALLPNREYERLDQGNKDDVR